MEYCDMLEIKLDEIDALFACSCFKSNQGTAF